MYKTIFLDMDGVLCDFNGHYKSLTGKDFHSFEHRQDAWDLLVPFNDTFFEYLPQLPDAKYLVAGVEELAIEYGCAMAILTAIPKIGRIATARIQKHDWINEHFPNLSCKFNIGPHAQHKQFHCIPGDVLIDDAMRNIQQWANVDGFGILHTSAEESLSSLRKHLEKST
jgi:5'-nucleotidase